MTTTPRPIIEPCVVAAANRTTPSASEMWAGMEFFPRGTAVMASSQKTTMMTVPIVASMNPASEVPLARPFFGVPLGGAWRMDPA